MDVGTRVLADRYELLAPLARGGMGQVWRARDRLLGRPVAVKILRSEFTDDPGFRARFRAEAQHAAMMVHPNIASVFDYGEVAAPDTGESVAYLVMELVEGESLAHLLHRERRLSPELTLSILRQTSAALAAAHAAGIVHRDVKPGNVLVAPDGTVKITDFGVALSASSVPLTGTGQVIGTAHYLSPEQAEGGKATPASDVYALGAVAYECVAGRRVFDGESSVQIVMRQLRDDPDPLPGDVPPDLRDLIMRALAKDPGVRYADGAALRAAVDRVTLAPGPLPSTGTAVLPLPLGALPTTSAPASAGAAMPPLRAPRTAPQAAVPPVRERDRRRRSKAGIWLLVGALFAVVGIIVGLGLLGGDGDPTASSASASSSAPPTSASPSPSPTSSAPAPPSTVAVAADDHVGRPVQDVRAELVAAGLQVEVVPVTTADAAEGTVTGVEPTGEVPLGGTVTVAYAVAPVPSPEPPADEGGGEEGNGNGDEGGGNGDEGGGNGDEGGGNGNEGNQGRGNGGDGDGGGGDGGGGDD